MSKNRSLAWMFVLAISCCLTPSPAGAFTVGSSNAFLESPKDNACWQVTIGDALRNICSSFKEVCYSLPVDHSGSTTVTIWAKQSASGGVQCFAEADSPDGSASSFSGWTTAVVMDSNLHPVILAAVSVGSGWSLRACCAVDHQDLVGAVTY